jgi:hypothetical protein
MRRAVLFVMMTLTIGTVAPAAGMAQSAKGFIGTWTYVSNIGSTRNGQKFYPYSADTIGMLVFAPNNRYTIIYIGSGFPKIIDNPAAVNASNFRFEAHHGLSEAQFLQRDAELRADGFALISKQMFEDSDGVSVQAVWTINDPIRSQRRSQQSCTFSPWLPSNEHQAVFDENLANHLYDQIVEGRSVAGERQYRGCFRAFPTNSSGPDSTAGQQSAVGVFAHFGTYVVNEAEKSFSFKVEAATYRSYVNTEQKRLFVINNDELSYSDVGKNNTITFRRDK